MGYASAVPVLEGAEEFPHVPLDLDEPEAIFTPVPTDQSFCSFGSMPVTPSSSNLFYLVYFQWVNFRRRISL
ncbi:MAG: hypothetical protein CK534_07400 [Nitrospirae bacterium]|nr:MAG: hypothetical protein CK534_07400 [Nitrospirota bacterium]